MDENEEGGNALSDYFSKPVESQFVIEQPSRPVDSQINQRVHNTFDREVSLSSNGAQAAEASSIPVAASMFEAGAADQTLMGASNTMQSAAF